MLLLDNRVKARPCDTVTITLYPGGIIGFRPARGRTEYRLPLASAYRSAIRCEVEEEKRLKRASKKAKKEES